MWRLESHCQHITWSRHTGAVDMGDEDLWRACSVSLEKIQAILFPWMIPNVATWIQPKSSKKTYLLLLTFMGLHTIHYALMRFLII